MPRGNLISTLLTIILVTGVLFVSVGVLSELDEATTGSGGQTTAEGNVSAAAKLDGTTWVSLGDATGTNETVVNSRGRAMDFSGASDSYLTSDATINVSNDSSWTVTQPVLAVNNTSSQQVLLSVGQPDLLLLYEPAGNWSAVYYTADDSYQVNVSAPSPGTTTFVTVRHNGSAIEILRGTTAGESANTSTANAISGNFTAANTCNCTLDETRAWNQTLTDSELSTFESEPVRPVSGASNRTLRVMYDQETPSAVDLWFTGADATASNVTYVSGFNGETMDEKTGALDVTGGNDYRWDTDGPRIQPVSGNRLDGAPVAFVDYTRETWESSAGAEIRGAVGDWLSLADIVPVVLMLALIVAVLRARFGA